MTRPSEKLTRTAKAGKAGVLAGTSAVATGFATVTTTSWSWWPLGWVASSVISWPVVGVCALGGVVISLAIQKTDSVLVNDEFTQRLKMGEQETDLLLSSAGLSP
jgi:hypothetical protein